MRLLHGYTNALTPQNILYNSDFYQEGGAPASNTVTGAFTYASNNCVFAEGWRINSYIDTNNMTVSYTRGLNKLHVEVTNLSESSGVRISQKIPISNISYENTYTFTFKISNLQLQNCEFNYSDAYLANGGTGSKYYSHKEYITDNTFIHTTIYKATTHSSPLSFFNFIIYFKNFTGPSKVSFDISDIAVYEGAYTNPPAPKNRLHYSNYDLEPVINPITLISIKPTSLGWKTLCSICQGINTAFNCLFSLERAYNNLTGYTYFLGGVSVYMHQQTDGTIYGTPTAKFYQLAASSGLDHAYFNKLRVTYKKESDNRIWCYLEVNINYTASNDVRFRVIDSSGTKGKLITEYQRLGASGTDAPTDRTVIGSEFTITYS